MNDWTEQHGPADIPTERDHEIPEPLDDATKFAMLVGQLLAPVHTTLAQLRDEIAEISRRLDAAGIAAE